MPSKPIYNYDLDKVEELESDTKERKGMLLRPIARLCGWDEDAFYGWLSRIRKSKLLRKVVYVPRDTNWKKVKCLIDTATKFDLRDDK
jgi:hypothetical protein